MANDFQILVKALIQASDLQGQLNALQDKLKPLKINLDLSGLKGGGVNDLTPQIQNAQKAADAFSQSTDNLKSKLQQVYQIGADGSKTLTREIETLNTGYAKNAQILRQLDEETGRLNATRLTTTDDAIKRSNEYRKYLQQEMQINEKYGKVQAQAIAKDRENVSVLSALEIKIKALTDAQREQINAEQRLAQIKSTTSITEKSLLMKELSRDISAATGNMNTFRQTIDFTIERFIQLGLITAVFRKIKQAISEVIDIVTELDTSLVELQKVSDVGGSQLEVFTKQAYDAGSELARTGKEVIDATTIFSRAGYELQDAFELSKTALLLTNVADGIDSVEEASSTLISVLKAFNMEAENSIHIVDGLNAVSNNFAIDTDNLAEILQRASGTLAQTGTTMEEIMGLAVGGFTTLRNAEMVASGLNMITQRMKGMSEEGEAIEGLVPKIEEALQKYTKGAVSMLDEQTGELRSTYDVLSDLAEVYPTLTSKQRAYLNEVIAGNRQNKILVAVMEGWDDVTAAVETAKNSTGSAMAENEKYLNSIEGKINAVQSAWQQLAQKTITDDTIKNFYDFLKVIIDLTSAMGGLQSILGILIILFSKQLTTALSVINKKLLLPLINSLKTFFSLVKTEGIKAIGVFSGLQLAVAGIGAAIAVFSIVSNAVSSAREAAIEANSALLENANTIEENKNKLDELIKSYEKLASSDDFSKNADKLEEAKTIQQEITNLVGDQASNLDLVNGKLDTQLSTLENISIEQAKQNRYDLEAAKIAADKNIELQARQSGGTVGFSFSVTSPKNLEEAQKLLDYYTKLRNEAQDAEKTNDAYYSMLIKNIEQLTPLVESATIAYRQFYDNEAFIAVAEASKSAIVQTKADLESFINDLIIATGATEEYAKALRQAANEKYYLISGIDDVGYMSNYISQTNTLTESFTKLNTKIDEIQGAYSSLSSAMKEYEENGKLSIDTVQSLLGLGAEYLQYLFDENGQLSINSEALKTLTEAKINDMKSLSSSLQESESADALENLKEEIYNIEQLYEDVFGEDAIAAKTEAWNEYFEELTRINKEYEYQGAILEYMIALLGEEANTLELAKEKLEDANSALDEATSAYDTLKDAIKEYNKTGVLSVETFQSLMSLSPQFLAMFFNQANAANMAEGAIYAQAEALKVAKIEELQAAASADLMNLALGNTDAMSDMAKSAVAAAGSSAATAGGKFLNAAGKANTMAAALRNVWSAAKGSSGTVSTADIERQAKAIISSYSSLAKSISSISVSGIGGGSSGSGGSSAAVDQAKEIAEAYDSLLSYTMKMLKKETDDRIDALEDELDIEEELYKAEKQRIEDEIDGYKKIIDKKKESLKLDKAEKDYQDEVNELNQDIADIQNELIERQFDTSESSQAEKLKLQEELAKKQADLEDKQYDRQVELSEEALDNDFDLYKENKEAKLTELELAFEETKKDYEDRIDLLKQYLEEENVIREQAIGLIEGRTQEFYTRLFAWNAKYGEVSLAVLQGIIDKSQEAVSAVSSSSGGSGGGGSGSESAKSSSAKASGTISSSVTSSKSGTSGGNGAGVSLGLSSSGSSSSGSSGSSGLFKTHHSGIDAGFVGNVKGNEQFLKALKGELVINPKQQNNYMNRILPDMITSSNSGIQCDNLLSITVSGNIDSDSVSKIQKTVENQFEELNRILNGNGIVRKANNLA